MKTPGSYSSSSSTNTPAPDLEVLSHNTPATPSNWKNSLDDEDDFLQFNVNQLLDEATSAAKFNIDEAEDPYNDRRFSAVFDQDRRRSSGVAVQQLLSQLDGIDMEQVFKESLSAADFLDSSGNDACDAALTWKVVVETAFMPKYYRNDRKNIQCFPSCTLGAQRNGTDTAMGHGKSTTWCRGAVSARAFAIDPETNIADVSMFEAFGAFVMNGESPKTKPLATIQDKIRGNIRKVDGRSFEVKIAPTVWKFEPALSKKKSEENRNQCYFIVALCFRGREVGRCVSPPFDLGSQKAEIRKKRALITEETPWEPKHLVLDSFAQASNWAWSAMGLRSPNPAVRKTGEEDPAGHGDAGEEDENLDALERGARQGQALGPSKASTTLHNTVPNIPKATGTAHQSQRVPESTRQIRKVQAKRISLALLLWLPPFGLFGAHHAYLGRKLYATVSAMTLNLFLVGWLFDALRIPALVHSVNYSSSSSSGSSSKTTSFMSVIEFCLVWLILGLIGGHRYVAGDLKMGLLYTATIGGCGVLWLMDGFRLGKLYLDACSKCASPNPNQSSRRQ